MLIRATIFHMSNMLGNRVLLARRDLEMKQAELARRVGVSRPFISDIERGKTTNVGVETVIALAGALGVRPAYLLGLSDVVVDEDEEELALGEVPSPYNIDPTTQELFGLIEGMTPAQRQQMAGIARLLLGGPTIIE